jgi:RHS repeat-associated protein
MKQINPIYTLILLCLFLSGHTLFAQSENKPTGDTQPSTQEGSITTSIPGNYNTSSGLYNAIATYSVYKKGLSLDSILRVAVPLKHVVLSTQYMDGLGRPIQTVGRKQSPGGNDAVEVISYDPFGREAQSFLPFTISETDGSFKASAFNSQDAFYDTHFGGKEDIYYGLKEFNGSPANRVIKEMAPGNSWVGSDKGVESKLLYNTVSEVSGPDGHDVRLWTIGNSASDTPQTSGLYDESELVLTEITNEDGRIIREFRDREERVVLRQVQSANSPSEGHTGWFSTYYVHDNRGNLRFVLPPKAVNEIIAASWNYGNADVNDLVFKYVFDERDRMIIRKTPGAGEFYSVYDLLDREVLTQNAEQRSGIDKTWQFKKYDEQGREVFTGFITTDSGRAALQQQADNWGAQDYFVKRDGCGLDGIVEAYSITISEHVSGTTIYRAKEIIDFLPGFDTDEEFETEVGGTLCGDYTYYQGYYDATFPLLKDYTDNDKFEIIDIKYYDDYDFTSKEWDTDFSGMYSSPADLLTHLTEVPQQYGIVRGLATGSKVKILGTDDWLTSVTFYDDDGREVQVQSENHLGGTDVTTTQYNFASQVINTYTKHENPVANGDNVVRTLKRFTYDNAGLLAEIEQRIGDTGTLKTLSTSTYNELSELSAKALGTDPVNTSNPLETLNFTYNIRGWNTGINDAYADNGTGAHYFGMKLGYDYGFDNTQLAGNIAGVIWRTKSSSRKRAYGYEYDNANRLIGADYNHLDTSETTWTKAVGSGTRDFSTSYTYDANGNILTLTREGVIAGSAETIDDLEYSYGRDGVVDTKSNQLIAVKEKSTSASLPEGFNNTNGTSIDYTYDDNGNLDLDNNKDISSITYNFLNLPVQVTFTNGRSITYSYDAGGTKLSKVVNDNGNISTTDYAGAFIYENNNLQFFSHEEGRVRVDSNGDYVNDFFIKDYLGNTRMTLTEESEVVEYRATMETDITPAGVNLEEYEESLFLNLEDTRESPSSYNTSTVTGINNNEAVRLNGSDSQRRIGPGKMLAVFPGDQISVNVESFHAGGGSSTGIVDDDDMLVAVAGVFGQLNGSSATAEGALYDLFNGPEAYLAAYAGNQTSVDQTRPRAYLNYLVFNQDFEYMDGGFLQTDQASGWKTLSTSLSITEGGYVYIYLSNENPNNFDVWFDDLIIVHTKSTILQEDHYYPYGMNIEALSGKAPQAKSNRFKYNGFEEQVEFDLDWYDYGARQFDPQLGRFLSVDPAGDLMTRHSPYNYAFDNPVRFTDPDGMMPTDPQDTKGTTLNRGVKISDRSTGDLNDAYNKVRKAVIKIVDRSLNIDQVQAIKDAYAGFENGANNRLTIERIAEDPEKLVIGWAKDSRGRGVPGLVPSKGVEAVEMRIFAEYTDLEFEGTSEMSVNEEFTNTTTEGSVENAEGGAKLTGDLSGVKLEVSGGFGSTTSKSTVDTNGKTVERKQTVYKYAAKLTIKMEVIYGLGTLHERTEVITIASGVDATLESEKDLLKEAGGG